MTLPGIDTRIHELRTWPTFFEEIAVTGRKRFEVRFDDRGFNVGDSLHLREWDPATEQYSGRHTFRTVTYAFRGPGVEKGYVAMGIV